MLRKKRQTKLHLRIEVGKIYVLSVGCLTVWVQPTCIVKAHSWACSKSLQCKIFPFNEKWTKHGGQTSLNEKCSRVSFWFNAKAEQVRETRWREKKEKKRKAIRPVSVIERNTLERRAEAKREPFGHCERNTSESFSVRRCSPCEEIESASAWGGAVCVKK